LLAAGLALVLLTAPAGALGAPSHPVFFALTGDQPGSERTPNVGFEGACGVALDSHADAYVSDYYRDAVDVYDTEFKFLTQISMESAHKGPAASPSTPPAKSSSTTGTTRSSVVPDAYLPGFKTGYHAAEVIDPGPAAGVRFDPTTNRIYLDGGTFLAEYEPSGRRCHRDGQGL